MKRILRSGIKRDFATLKMELISPFRRIILRKHVADKKAFLGLKDDVCCKRVIIFPPTIDWDMPLYQRPQQLAVSYSNKEDIVVIYITKNLQYDKVSTVKKVKENLWLVNDSFSADLKEYLETAREKIVSISWTINKRYLELLQPDRVIYEYIDELEIFGGYGSEMEKDHLEFLKNSDVAVCTATKLYRQAEKYAKKPLLSPNAGDYDFFVNTDSYEIDPIIKDKIKPYKCVLGYYGAIASWFDYELIKSVAEKHSEWVFVLVGVDYDGSIYKSEITKMKNIVYVPPQPYRNLPGFLKAFDIAMIPFVINEITLSTSPVKLFEYMAAGKPIISSKMPECLKYQSVKTYSNEDEFCEIVDGYMAMEPENKYWEVLRKEALENTWDTRTDEILNAL